MRTFVIRYFTCPNPDNDLVGVVPADNLADAAEALGLVPCDDDREVFYVPGTDAQVYLSEVPELTDSTELVKAVLAVEARFGVMKTPAHRNLDEVRAPAAVVNQLSTDDWHADKRQAETDRGPDDEDVAEDDEEED